MRSRSRLLLLATSFVALTACSGTDDTPDAGLCISRCEEGAGRCLSGERQRCQDDDDDGCFEWVAFPCGAGLSCSSGECVSTCSGECTVAGAKNCQDGEVVTCAEGAGGCLEWTNPTTCTGGKVCSQGECAGSCTSACTEAGAKKCGGNAILTCADSNGDGCLEWVTGQDCGSQVCSNGACAAACQNECATPGSKTCEGRGTKACGNFDADSCLEWGTVQACAAGLNCSNGVCGANCSDECSTSGATECRGSSVVTCGNTDGDSCLEWGTPTQCGNGLVCAGGSCKASCTNDCSATGSKSCSPAGLVIVCGQHDTDSCLDWSEPSACESGLVCDRGACVSTCTDSCPSEGARTCETSSTTQYRVCSDHNGDGCREWGSPVACSGSLVCTDGACVASCSSTCPTDGAKRCAAGGVATCGDHNGDGCREWSAPAFCEQHQTCTQGACTDKPAPAGLVISEIVYDSTGADKDTFVELHGTAGTDLSGVKLVGVNGNGGSEYNGIELSGTIGADGLFVVAHPDAQPALAAQADLKTSKADYQNGPDTVKLVWNTTVLDAVAYGTFAATDAFAGEKSSGGATGAGKALARKVGYVDTNDNAADFSVRDPTPGAAPTHGGDPCATTCSSVGAANCACTSNAQCAGAFACSASNTCVCGARGTVAFEDVCGTNADCASGACDAIDSSGGFCTQPCGSDDDCVGDGYLPKCESGLCTEGGNAPFEEFCETGADCASGACVAIDSSGGFCSKECAGPADCDGDLLTRCSGFGLCAPPL